MQKKRVKKFTMMLLLVVVLFFWGGIFHSIISDIISNHCFCLYEDYIREYHGSTTPHDHILMTENNVEIIFDKVETKLYIKNMKDLENELKKYSADAKRIKVIVEPEKEGIFRKKRKYYQYEFEEVRDDFEINYSIIESQTGQFYVSFWGTKYMDSTKTRYEYLIETWGNEVTIREIEQ